MPRSIYRRCLQVLIACALSAGGLLLGGVAHAADQPVQLSIDPVGQPGHYFDVTIKPGERLDLAVALGNHGPRVITVRTYAANVYTIINGGFGAALRETAATGATSWLSYPTSVFDLPAGRSQTRAFSVSVPAGTAPGQYIASVILENDQPVKGSGPIALNQIVRQAVAVAVRVPGPLQPALSIGGASDKTAAGKTVIDIGVANTGNAHLKPAGELQVRDRNNVVVSQAPISMDSLYAHTDTKVQITLAKRLLPGPYTVSLTLKDPTYGTTATADKLPLTVAKTIAATGTVGRSANLPQVVQSATAAGRNPLLLGVGAVLLLAAFAALKLLFAPR